MATTPEIIDFTDQQILDKFWLLNATIGLTKSAFGYFSCGQPSIINAIEKGRKVHDKTRRRITEALIEIEKAHTEPHPAVTNRSSLED